MTAAVTPDPAGLATVDIRARYLPVDGRLAYVERIGEGPAVLLVHTAGQSGVQWRCTVGPLAAAGYEAVVVDLPGHGRSEPAVDGPVTDLSWYSRWPASRREWSRARTENSHRDRSWSNRSGSSSDSRSVARTNRTMVSAYGIDAGMAPLVRTAVAEVLEVRRAWVASRA